MTRMLLARVGFALLLGGSVGLGVAAPAAAQTTITITDECGFVDIVMTDVDGELITMSRNGVVASSFTAQFDEITPNLGASPGDQIEVSAGSTSESHTYVAPDGCQAPQLSVEFESGCDDVLMLHVSNSGAETVSGFSVGTTEHPIAFGVSFPPGGTTIPLPAAEYSLIDDDPAGNIMWLEGAYARPGECDQGQVEAAFTDGCEGVTVAVTSTIPRPSAYRVIRNVNGDTGDPEIEANVREGVPGSHEVAATTGDTISVFRLAGRPDADLSQLFDLVPVSEHQFTQPASCQGGGEDGGNGESEDGDGGDGGSLPVTGSTAGLALGGGIVLLGVGAGFAIAVYRPRIRFTVDDGSR